MTELSWREQRRAELHALARREEYESWVRCLDVERAHGDLDDDEYDRERRRYAEVYGIEEGDDET